MNQTKRRLQHRRRHGNEPTDRRGVLLLVVLSMLVLFLLIGTTFLITSGQYRTQSQVVERANRSTFQPADLLERALMQLVRDTNNANSVIRHHSLLRDLYGTDGFVGRITMNGTTQVGSGTGTVTREAGPGFVNYGNVTGERIAPRYAGVDVGAAISATNPVLGPTRGQIVEFYVADVEVGSLRDASRLSDHNAVGLGFDENGIPYEHRMSSIDGYYEGCLLTLLDGPCRGQTVRVVGYDHVYTRELTEGGGANAAPTTIVVSRWQVMAPKRVDGQPLRAAVLPGTVGEVGLTDLVDVNTSNPGNPVYTGHRFLVNGRPFNGSGVGYNPLALSHDLLNGVPAARLSALEPFSSGTGFFAGLERALIPNAAHYDNRMASVSLNPSAGVDPWASGYTAASFRPLTRGAAVDDPNQTDDDFRRLYQGFAGPGDTDESYDAPDTQNMALASQSLEPRLRGRVVNAAGLSVDPDTYYPNNDAPAYLDLEGVTIPSFHRPALANFWFHRLYNSDWLSGIPAADRVRAILSPYDQSGAPRTGLDFTSSAQVAAIKRKFMMRPLREDHPDFDGSNPLSRYGTAAIEAALQGNNLVNDNGEITFPYWEAVGPWDVDNDGDGVPDSVWVDVGLPVQQTEDGRWYKPLVAMLVEDLDGRLNLNVHGSADDVVNNAEPVDPSSPDFDALLDFNSLDVSLNSGGLFLRNLAQDYANPRPLQSSNQLSGGSGWGVAEVSLRSILSPTLPLENRLNASSFRYQGDPQYDDYARLLIGRPDPAAASRTVSAPLKVSVPFGRYGSVLIQGLTSPDGGAVQLTKPGRSFVADTTGVITTTRDARTPLEFLGYPEYLGLLEEPSGFSTPPDLSGRYSTAVSAAGAAIFEARSDRLLSSSLNRVVPAIHDSPYELDVSSEARRLAPVSADAVRLSYEDPNNVDSVVDSNIAPLVDDAPFSPAELERLLRAFDGDANKLPDRLWEIVDSFDPDKLALSENINAQIRTGSTGHVSQGVSFQTSSLASVVAAAKAAVNRRVVTTDSFDLPVPNENWTERLALGADGLPGVPWRDVDGNGIQSAGDFGDDDGDGRFDEGDEVVLGYDQIQTAAYDTLYNDGCDDYVVVMREDPPASPRITDYLRYRITLELLRNRAADRADLFSTTPATRAAARAKLSRQVNAILVGSNQRPTELFAVHGPTDAPLAPTDPALFTYGGLLAPELMAGLRMNLNRPFGDGRDNNDNGVVDEPGEAGEPFVDSNGDGSRQDPEPYVDLNKNDAYDESLDEVWVDANNDGVIDRPGEVKPFSYTRGVDANGRGMFVDSNSDGVYENSEPLVRDDAGMARQLYARHLYCLMLALTDENYLAPYDSSDPQVLHYLNPLSGTFDSGSQLPRAESSIAYWIAIERFIQEFRTEISSGTLLALRAGAGPENLVGPGGLFGDHTRELADANEELRRRRVVNEARQEAMRKLTRRRIAQWAINVVDFRDPDAIQTPFEYDENPWDGWNVVDTQATADDASDDVVYPLDGDLSTDENYTQLRIITTTQISAPGIAIDPSRSPYDVNNFTTDPGDIDAKRISLPDRTRGVVWGAERPEAILTEGLAWHDRRLEDLDAGGGQLGATLDDDLDQLRKPKGYVYLEAFNPWTDKSQSPAEFYSHVDRDGNLVRFNDDRDGVRFDRLSNLAADPNSINAPADQTRSPVWRLACVEEHPLIRNASVSPNLAEEIGSALGIGPLQDIKEVSDDSSTSLNGSETVNGANDYTGINLSGVPWAYSTFTLPGASEEPVTKYGNVDRKTKNAPVLQRAYSEMWLKKKNEAILAFATQAPNINDGVRDADGLAIAVGVLETPPRLADTSFPTFDRFAQPSGAAYSEFVISSRSDGRYVRDEDLDDVDPNPPIQAVDRVVLLKPTRFIERVFYMAGPNSKFRATGPGGGGPRGNDDVSGNGTTGPAGGRESLPDLANPGYRIPDLSYDIPVASGEVNNLDFRRSEVGVSSSPNVGGIGLPDKAITVRISKFASLDLLAINRDDRDEPIQLAPLLPGRRAVIGTSGPVYDFGDPAAPTPGTFTGEDAKDLQRRYTTVASQLHSSVTQGDANAEDEFLGPVDGVTTEPRAQLRRFEMIPSADPDDHQFAVRMNGYTESQSAYLDLNANFTKDDGESFNLTVGPTSNFASEHPFAPVIAVPIDHFSITEPLDEYFARQLELDPSLDRQFETNLTGRRASDRPAEGYFKDGNGPMAFDEPFDLLPELIENQTTPNYRAMHLERLANPLLPWNPPPMRVTGEPDGQHDPDLLVNPYLPVDAQALDVTAFNSYSELEEDQVSKPGASTEFVHVPTVASGGGSSQDYGPESRHRRPRPLVNEDTAIGFSANERDRPVGPFVSLWNYQPARLLWRQSPGTTVSEVVYETLYQGVRAGYSVYDNDRVTVGGGGDALDPNRGVEANGDGRRVGDYDTSADERDLQTNYEQHVIDFPWRTTLGFPSWLAGEFHTGSGLRWFTDVVADLAVQNIDLDADGIPEDLLGAAEVNEAPIIINTDGRPDDPASLQESSTTPAFAWPNRPFASAGELLQVPAWGGSRMLSYYSTFNWLHTQMPGFLHDTQVNPYNGEAGVRHDGLDYNLGSLGAGTTFDGDYTNDGTPSDGATDLLNVVSTNDLRFREMLGHFGHLLNFFETARFPSYAAPAEANDEAPRGAAHFYRVLDYVHVPSRFVATDTILNTDVFGATNINAADPRAKLAAPFNRVDRYREPGRVNLNTIVGRRDANEVTRTDSLNGNGANDPDFDPARDQPRLGDYWSEVYDGLMHRVKDTSLINYAAAVPRDKLVAMGHLGPAWRDVALSRRGYVQSTFDPTVDPGDESFRLSTPTQNQVDYSPRRMHPAFPTFFANPFRAPGEGANVPLAHMVQTGVDATMLRAHPLSPGADGAWGRRGVDDFTVKKDAANNTIANLDRIRDDAGEAGVLQISLGGSANAGNLSDRLQADVVLARFEGNGARRGAVPDTLFDEAFKTAPGDPDPRTLSPVESRATGTRNAEISKRATPVALFSGATIEPSLDTERNSTTRYEPIQRMASLATTRSNVYAAWITIGFFEVKEARDAIPALTDNASNSNNGRYFLANGDFKSDALREEFFRVYPNGWTLGQELDLEIGQNHRHRGFYVIDRSRPVAFRPGEDANVAETILLRRRIE